MEAVVKPGNYYYFQNSDGGEAYEEFLMPNYIENLKFRYCWNLLESSERHEEVLETK